MDISVSEEDKKIEEDTKTISFQFPFILLKTQRGKNLMEKIASLGITERLGTVAIYLFPAIGAVGFSLMLFSASVMLSSAPIREFVRESGPFVHIMIPGLNPYVPLIYGWVALIIAMIVHEGSHGILARYFKLKIKSSGLILFLILPIGAFVDIDEEELKKIAARKTGRVMAAGPMSNFVVALVSLLGLMLVVGSMAPISGGVGVVGVYQDWPAHLSGIEPTDIILSIEGIDVSSSDDIKSILANYQPGDTISVKLLHEKREEELSVVLASSDNSTSPVIGFTGLDSDTILNILDDYRRPRITSPLIYLFIPTFTMAQWRVPFSDTMNNFYTSPLGDYTYLAANILFWLWFVNFNLAIFNALPLYPLDGGQALRNGLESYGSSKGWKENTAKRIVTALSLFIVALLISVIVGPYVLG